MKHSAIFVAVLLLAGCDNQPGARAYWEHPVDAEVRQYAFQQCLTVAKGPRSTVYSDWDEAMAVCDRAAEDMARYCPARTKWPCLVQYDRPRSDVRAILPKGQTDDR